MTTGLPEQFPGILRAVSRDLERLAGILESREQEESSEVSLLALEEAAAAYRDALEEVASLLPRPHDGNDRILVVDDDPVSLDMMATFLGRYGEVTTAAAGGEALAVVTKAIRSGKNFRLVLLDVMMPEMDGHEVMKRIRGLEEVYSAGAPAIIAITTALGDRGTVLRARQAGPDGYFVKPVDLDKLGSWVEGKGFSKG